MADEKICLWCQHSLAGSQAKVKLSVKKFKAIFKHEAKNTTVHKKCLKQYEKSNNSFTRRTLDYEVKIELNNVNVDAENPGSLIPEIVRQVQNSLEREISDLTRQIRVLRQGIIHNNLIIDSLTRRRRERGRSYH